MAKTNTIADLREQLQIDEDDLDRCLVDHSTTFYHVAQNHAMAVGERDQIKLNLENARIELDAQLRKKMAEADEKITETALDKGVRGMPRIQKLTQEHLDASKKADEWQALLHGFQQRSFALGKLVDWKIAQMRHLGVEHGVKGAHRDLAEANRAEAGRQRRIRKDVESN